MCVRSELSSEQLWSHSKEGARWVATWTQFVATTKTTSKVAAGGGVPTIQHSAEAADIYSPVIIISNSSSREPHKSWPVIVILFDIKEAVVSYVLDLNCFCMFYKAAKPQSRIIVKPRSDYFGSSHCWSVNMHANDPLSSHAPLQFEVENMVAMVTAPNNHIHG